MPTPRKAQDYLDGTAALLPPGTYEAVTPSDTDELVHVCRQLLITGNAGNVVLVGRTGGPAITLAVTAGQIINGCFRQVKATGTTATGIVAAF